MTFDAVLDKSDDEFIVWIPCDLVDAAGLRPGMLVRVRLWTD